MNIWSKFRDIELNHRRNHFDPDLPILAGIRRDRGITGKTKVIDLKTRSYFRIIYYVTNNKQYLQ